MSNEENKNQDAKAFKLVLSISILICLVVILLNKRVLPAPEVFPDFIYKLPLLNACINATCSLLLLTSLWAVKTKRLALHKKLNLTAFFLSALFFVSYITAHYFIADTVYGDVNHNGFLEDEERAAVSGSRIPYLVFLLSHIFLAAIVLPLILLSFYYALKKDFVKHKKITRFSYPIWLYVTISGVLVYILISPYYNY